MLFRSQEKYFDGYCVMGSFQVCGSVRLYAEGNSLRMRVWNLEGEMGTSHTMTSIGLYHTVVGVLLLPASLLFGLLWQAFGAAAAFLTGAALALGALLLFLVDGTGRRAYPG